MPFIANKTEPCTFCNVDIPKGASSGWTWDRTHRGYIHIDCIRRRKDGGHSTQTPSQPSSSQSSQTRSEPSTQTPTSTQSKRDMLDKLDEARRIVVEAIERETQAPKSTAIQTIIDEDAIEKIVEKKLEKHTRKIEIKIDDKPSVKFDQAHFKLDELVRLVSTFQPNGTRTNVYLHGPAGSGKTSGAHQVAKAFSMEDKYTFYPLNPMTPPSSLLGFMHAGGEYVESELFRRYTTGGVILLDEVDNTSASLGTTLNGLVENGLGAFPHGMFPRHKDCIIICAGNTVGLGGDVRYPERRALDGAFRDRFAFLEWPYDEKLTEGIVRGIIGDKAREFIEWVKRIADEIQARRPTAIVSPRAYLQGATLEKAGFSRQAIRTMVIERGVSL